MMDNRAQAQPQKISFRSNEAIPSWRKYVNGLIAAEISALSRYYNQLIQFQPREEDTGVLFDAIDNPEKSVSVSVDEVPDLQFDTERRSIVLLNGNINHDWDIQGTLANIRKKLARTSRVVLVVYNPYYRTIYKLANLLGIRKGEQPDTFVTETDLDNIANLAGYEVVRMRQVAYAPMRWHGIGDFLNKVLPAIPFLRSFSFASVITLRPVVPEKRKPSLTIVIPARNEKGNIENALKRLPDLGGAKIEIIFVEGHSSDDTWGEIQRVQKEYGDKVSISSFQQTGKGKSDAVRLGFSKAKSELLTILDADLTMPPELLHRFYDAYCSGRADFINGNRLVYPMEGQAMRFLNHLGNIFFAKALSFVLGSRLGDSLCGTKLVARHDYDRMIAWRNDFGDFDPFGDFELLFPAVELGLGIVDVAIRYRDRVYGSTNIRRFYHGWMLLKMTLTGLVRIRTGRLKPLA